MSSTYLILIKSINKVRMYEVKHRIDVQPCTQDEVQAKMLKFKVLLAGIVMVNIVPVSRLRLNLS